MAHYIGIDVGTGSARACVIDSEGSIRGLASEDIGLWQPQPGHYEQSTNNIWQCIANSVRRAVTESKVDPASIQGIGFDATCSLAVFTHDTDESVSVTGPDFKDNDHNVILWLDHRPVEETKQINATQDKVLKYVGGSMSIEMEIPKVLWLKNHMPRELFNRCKFYDLTDALTHLATGNESRSFCSAVCKQGFIPVGVDGSVKGWQGSFLDQIGLSELHQNNFKQLGGVDGANGAFFTAGERCGVLSEKAAEELGLRAGISVGSGVIDAYAGWIGTVGAKADLPESAIGDHAAVNDQSQAYTRLAAVAGTSTCHLAMTPQQVFVPGVWGPYRDVIFPGQWMAEGGQSATGALLKHVIDTHPAAPEAQRLASASGFSIYTFLNQRLEELQEQTKAPFITFLGRHLFYYGDLFGNRSPIADPHMSGAVIGLTSDVSVDRLALFYYAAMEFIALQTRQIIETMNKAGHQLSSIFMSGSQCQNEILVKLVATACNMPIVVPEYVNAAVVHGAAMLGAKAASADTSGKTEDLWQIMARMSKPGRVVPASSDRREHQLLQAKYQVFLEQCYSQRRYRDEVDAVIKKWQDMN